MKYHCAFDLLFDWFGISCMTTDNFCFYSQKRLIQTSQTGGQLYNDTSPFSIPCLQLWMKMWASSHTSFLCFLLIRLYNINYFLNYFGNVIPYWTSLCKSLITGYNNLYYSITNSDLIIDITSMLHSLLSL